MTQVRDKSLNRGQLRKEPCSGDILEENECVASAAVWGPLQAEKWLEQRS